MAAASTSVSSSSQVVVPVSPSVAAILRGERGRGVVARIAKDPKERKEALAILAALDPAGESSCHAAIWEGREIKWVSPEALSMWAGRPIKFVRGFTMAQQVALKCLTLKERGFDPVKKELLLPSPLALIKSDSLGIGVVATQTIPAGTYVCSYAGELKMGAASSDNGYCLDCMEQELHIDASLYTSEGALIQDSVPNAVYVQVGIPEFPYFETRLLTLREIAKGEQLFVNYGAVNWKRHFKTLNPAGEERAVALLQKDALRGMMARIASVGGVTSVSKELYDPVSLHLCHDYNCILYVLEYPELFYRLVADKKICVADIRSVFVHYENECDFLKKTGINPLKMEDKMVRIFDHPRFQYVYEEIIRNMDATETSFGTAINSIFGKDKSFDALSGAIDRGTDAVTLLREITR